MHWRDRYLYCMEAVNRAQAATGEIKGTYLNVTAGDDGGHVRTRRVREGARIGHRHDRSGHRLHGDPVDGQVGAQNDMILHLHRAGHSTYTRQKTHGVTFRVICEVDAPRGGRPHPRGYGGRQARGRSELGPGLLRRLREEHNAVDLQRGLFFEQDWAGLRERHARRVGRDPRGTDAPAAHLPGRRRRAPVRRWHHRPPHGHPGRSHGQPGCARGHGARAQRRP